MKKNNMKGLLIFIFGMFLFPNIILAGETVNVDSETTLRQCVLTDENTCRLTASIELNAIIELTKTIVIDLNGHDITPSQSFVSGLSRNIRALIFVGRGETLTINDATGLGKIDGGTSGKIYGAIQLTLESQTTDDETTRDDAASLIVNDGTIEAYYYAISGNGTRHDTNITINGGVVKGLCEDDSLGIFHPQKGILTINGGTISGTSGIEIRSGELEVNAGTITGSNGELIVTPNGSGSTTNGAGIAMAQHTTKNDLEVVINGGIISGYYALYESNPQDNTSEELAKVQLEINGGTFNAINDGTIAIYSEDKTEFIKGGNYNVNPSSTYLTTGYVAKQIGTTYKVGTEKNITVGTVTKGTLTADKTKAIEGETVTLTLTPNEGYEISTIKVLKEDDTEVTVTDNKFVMPNSAVIVTAVFTQVTATVEIPTINPETKVEKPTVGVKESENLDTVLLESLAQDTALTEKIKDVSVIVEPEIKELKETDLDEALVKTIKEQKKDLTVATFFDISFAVKNAKTDATLGTLKELTEEVELMILLPEELKNASKDITRTFYVVREHDDKVELLEAKISTDGKYLVFKSNVFSTYALAYTDTENPKTADYLIYLLGLGSISLIGLAGLYLKKRFN